MRRYGVFRQVTGAVHKEFQWNTHVIDGYHLFPNGMPREWKFGRSIDYHQSVPWAIIFAALSPDDELFIWDEMNPDPHKFTTRMIVREMIEEHSLDYRFRVNLIDKLATEVQTNSATVNTSAMDDMNAILRDAGKINYQADTPFESWDDRSTKGQDKVRERLINSKICGRPFNNLQKRDGKEVRLPTLWIFNNCHQMAMSLKSWKMETWVDRDAQVTKDQKDKPEMKWSHFNKALECLLKDSRFRATPYVYENYREEQFKKTYFHGRG